MFLSICVPLASFLPVFLHSGRSRSSSPGNSPLLDTMASNTSTVTTTIKIQHYNPSFRLFSGEDTSYSALEFLISCEDVKANSNIIDDRDKISKIRSNLKSDFKVAKMMSASAFDSHKIKNN